MKEQDFCPVHDSINLLQEKWTLHIIRSLLAHSRGFNEIARTVGGVNPTTLTQRLEHLEKHGLITKTVESTMPPRTRYELTEAGEELEQIIESISAWAAKHMRRCKKKAEQAEQVLN